MMQIPKKTLKNGFSMPVFGVGTWEMGGRMEHDSSNDDEGDILALRAALDRGITHIDTAEMYAAGHAETLVASAIEGMKRDALFLVSKVSPEHLSFDDVLRSAEASLQRLGTDYLDLYLVHKPNPSIPIADTMRAMNRLQEEGLIRNIGVSNFTVERMEAAQQSSKSPIVANQVHYNLSVREIEQKKVREYCIEHNIMLIAWRPIRDIGEMTSMSLMQEMCEKYQKTSVQIAINWLISQPTIVTLTKTSSVEHLDENMGSVGWVMEPEDIERLRREFPNQIDVSDAVPLL